MRPSLDRMLAVSAIGVGFCAAIPASIQQREDSSNGALQSLLDIRPSPTPSSAEEAFSRLRNVHQQTPAPQGFLPMAGELLSAGLTPGDAKNSLAYIRGELIGDNSMDNINLRNPSPPAYPKANKDDAPYDVSELELRAAIHIPATFRYGAKGAPQPIILVPGTGATGYETFAGNYIPLLQSSNIADPVWLNIPGNLLNDVQTNAEYVAYAINYIYGVSNQREVAVLSWSQGGIDAQWAYKYWPSTRGRVTDQISFSPDYHGSILANFLASPHEPLPPSLLQQEYNSNLITTMRNEGGDSAYVPTTTIYSGFVDEIVEPQQGTGASAYIHDARNVGVSNNEVQLICPGQPAGGFYTHEGTLYNNLGFALTVDALQHNGPGRAERLDLNRVCALPLSQGLDLANFLETEDVIPVAVLNILLYPAPVTTEPPIREYARG